MDKFDNKNNSSELMDVVDPLELAEIENELNQYLVKYPDEQKINMTIDALRQYVPEKKKASIHLIDRFLSLIQHSKNELSLISKLYWLSSTILFILGYFFVIESSFNPMITLIILTPIPFILGLVEVFKGRELGLLEIEMSCKFSAHEIMLTRLFLTGVFNITLNTILTIAFLPLIGSVYMWELLLVWFTPFTMFAVISLWLSMKFRRTAFITTVISLWIVFSIMLISKTEIILNINIAFYLLFMGVGLFLLTLQIKQLISKYSSYEGVENVEVSY
ncbi:hypothetical protein H1D32_11880 [Anaerobacillus sp. CMMVII]|uniref:hypothetical protein n=1 Tax=Anaerobacillus sp. CMMVII TaxID=2755588 RepID=UPI0021B7A96E|nr:hypothetical protein [Anaerobacillus sp. CMMVII]MCT8138388.1 hypothetical protein [Anaerobacillus sp. CMMVII]